MHRVAWQLPASSYKCMREMHFKLFALVNVVPLYDDKPLITLWSLLYLLDLRTNVTKWNRMSLENILTNITRAFVYYYRHFLYVAVLTAKP